MAKPKQPRELSDSDAVPWSLAGPSWACGGRSAAAAPAPTVAARQLPRPPLPHEEDWPRRGMERNAEGGPTALERPVTWSLRALGKCVLISTCG